MIAAAEGLRPAGNLTLRPMVAADLEAVTALERRIFSDAWSLEAFRGEVEGGAHCRPLVAESAGRIVGYMVAWIVADEAHLGNLGVAPGMRRRGIARRLLDRLIEMARNERCRLITLEVRRSNKAAQALYEQYGFSPVMVRRGYYSDNREDALVLVRPLTEGPPDGPGS